MAQSASAADALLTSWLLPECQPCPGRPMTVQLEQVANLANEHSMGVQVWIFHELAAGQPLQDAVRQHASLSRLHSHHAVGPSSPTSLVFISQRIMRGLRFKSVEEGAKRTAMWWRTVNKYRQHWQAQVRNMMLGNFSPVIFRTVVFGTTGVSDSKPFNIINWPAIVIDAEGRQHWGMVGQSLFASQELQQVWALRDLLATEYTPTCISCVAEDSGVLMWQNSASMAMLGCHGLHNTKLLSSDTAISATQAAAKDLPEVPAATPPSSAPLSAVGSSAASAAATSTSALSTASAADTPASAGDAGAAAGAAAGADTPASAAGAGAAAAAAAGAASAASAAGAGAAAAGAAAGATSAASAHAGTGTSGTGEAQHPTAVPDSSSTLPEQDMEEHINFLELLFNGNQELMDKMQERVQDGNTFRAAMHLGHPVLRAWLGLGPNEEAHHDVQVSLTRDPFSLKRIYLISQVNITEEVLARRKLAETHAQLQAEKAQIDALLHRQYQLIECLSRITEVQEHAKRGAAPAGPNQHAGSDEGDWSGGGEGAASSGQQGGHAAGAGPASGKLASGGRTGEGATSAAGLIESVRRQIAGQGLASIKLAGLSRGSHEEGAGKPLLEILERLGEGSFGKVYRGLWRGTEVAIKSMVLPSKMSGAEKLERMAIMEAAISSSLSHPNVVQTFTYTVTTSQGAAVKEGSEAGGSTDMGSSLMTGFSSFHDNMRMSSSNTMSMDGLEVRLVLEFMDGGSLRDVLSRGLFFDYEDGYMNPTVNYHAVLETAADVAKGMLHLHSLNVVHGDLKARNVLLHTSASEPRGFVAKISDFGLSVQMGSDETHISKAFVGTTSHMAPEVLLDGRQSKAADVYAFGITMYEVFTGQVPFKGTPQVLLAYQVAQNKTRPAFPEDTPREYAELAQRCWAPEPADRPCFEEVLSLLLQMRRALPGPTKGMQIRQADSSSNSDPHSIANRQGPGTGYTGFTGAASEVLLMSDSPQSSVML